MPNWDNFIWNAIFTLRYLQTRRTNLTKRNYKFAAYVNITSWTTLLNIQRQQWRCEKSETTNMTSSFSFVRQWMMQSWKRSICTYQPWCVHVKPREMKKHHFSQSCNVCMTTIRISTRICNVFFEYRFSLCGSMATLCMIERKHFSETDWNMVYSMSASSFIWNITGEV